MKGLKKLLPIAMVVAMLVALLTPATVLAAGDLTSVSATVDPITADTSTKMTVSFNTTTEIPLDGKIIITALDFTWAAGVKTDNTTVTDDAAGVTLASATSSNTNKQIVIVLNASANISA